MSERKVVRLVVVVVVRMRPSSSTARSVWEEAIISRQQFHRLRLQLHTMLHSLVQQWPQYNQTNVWWSGIVCNADLFAPSYMISRYYMGQLRWGKTKTVCTQNNFQNTADTPVCKYVSAQICTQNHFQKTADTPVCRILTWWTRQPALRFDTLAGCLQRLRMLGACFGLKWLSN